MPFSVICKAATALFLALSLILLFSPEFIYWLFGVGVGGAEMDVPTANFIARRAAMLFLGLAVVSWKLHSAPPSDLRRGVCLGLGLSMGALAVLGFAEFYRGFAGWPILLAVCVETAFGAVFLHHSRRS